jgi:hypothetical protein
MRFPELFQMNCLVSDSCIVCDTCRRDRQLFALICIKTTQRLAISRDIKKLHSETALKMLYSITLILTGYARLSSTRTYFVFTLHKLSHYNIHVLLTYHQPQKTCSSTKDTLPLNVKSRSV